MRSGQSLKSAVSNVLEFLRHVGATEEEHILGVMDYADDAWLGDIVTLREYEKEAQESEGEGIYCCPGVPIVIEHHDVDQTIVYLHGKCSVCGSVWSITKDEAGEEGGEGDAPLLV